MKSTILLLLATATLVSAETTENLLEQVRAAASAAAREARNTSAPTVQQRTYEWQMFVDQLDRYQSGDVSPADLLRTIQGLEAAAGSEKLATLCHSLATQLRAEQEKQEAALADKMEKDFAEALRSALAAKSFKDVDAPLAAVHACIQRRRVESSANPKLQKLLNQGQQLWQFLRQWQDFLAGVDLDESTNAQQRLERLLNSGADFSNLIPRSEILERLAGKKVGEEKKWTQEEIDKKAREILGATHTLADLPESIRQLQDLVEQKHTGFFSMVAGDALQHLSNLERIRRDLDKGLFTSMSLTTVVQNSNTEVNQLLSPIRAQLLLYALPRLLGAGDADKPLADDTVPSYLHRLTLAAREKADWNMLQRAIELTQTLNLEPTANANDRNALQSFLAGLNQERAKQFTFAVISYEAALKAGSQLVSAETIGEHLERIHKEHPEEYEQGVRSALTPSPTGEFQPIRPR